MHWWDLNTKSFRQFSAIKNTFWHALMGPEHKIFSVNFSYQENLLTCIGGTLTQSLFVDFQQSRILMDMQWWDLNPKSFRWFSATEKTLTCIGETWTRNLFGDLQLSRILIVMHWWDLNTKSFRQFSAIKNTFWHALMGPEHKIFSVIFSYQENLLTCIGGTLTQSLFVDFQQSTILIDMLWWDLKTSFFRRFSAIKITYWHALVGPEHKSFRRFSAIKNTYLHALVEPEHKIFSAIFSYQENLLTCIGGTWTQNLLGDFQLSRKLIDMLWRDFNTKSFRRFSAIKSTFWHA